MHDKLIAGLLSDQPTTPITRVKDIVYRCYEIESKRACLTSAEAKNLAKQLSIAFSIASEATE